MSVTPPHYSARMTPSEIGERAEAAVLFALAAMGKRMLVPFAGHYPYDLVFEEDGKFLKVQCKSGRARNGVLMFRTHYVGRGPARDYRDEIDFFGVYCHERSEVYLVPVEDAPPRNAHLRLEPPRNGQEAGIRHAAKYLVMKGLPKLID